MSSDDTDDKKSSGKLIQLKRKPPGGEKLKPKGVHSEIVKSMLGDHGFRKPFPIKFHRWVDVEGNSVIYAEDNNRVVRTVANDFVHFTIAQYWDECILTPDDQEWGVMGADDADKIRRLWITKCPGHSDLWLPLAWNNSPGLALHRVCDVPSNFGYGLLMSCPRFKDIMERTTDHKTFMAWIGSLFDPKSQRQQYVWIYGSGGNGKSAMIRALTKYLGPVSANENPPDGSSKHWTAGLRNKRLVVFADCNNTKFVTSGLFKSLTGEDGIRMEPKYFGTYTDSLQAKFLISSNDKPELSSSAADLRRCLFFKIGEIKKDFGPDYEDKLIEESPYFFNICWDVYQEAINGNPRHQFKCDNAEEMDSVISSSELEFESFATEWINVIKYDESIIDREREYITPKQMIQLMNNAGFKSRRERRELINYLERTHGVIKLPVYYLDKGTRRNFINCRIDSEEKGSYPGRM